MDIKAEKKLIKQIKKGEQGPFKILYEEYAEYALRSCYYITGNNNYTADIVQETFIKVYRGLDTFNHNRPFKPWFYQILLNESKRYMKKQNAQAIPIKSTEVIDYLHKQKQKESEIDFTLDILEEVSETHRIVLTLKYLNGFTEKEIANLLHLNVNTVKSRLFKARGKLREIIGGVEDE